MYMSPDSLYHSMILCLVAFASIIVFFVSRTVKNSTDVNYNLNKIGLGLFQGLNRAVLFDFISLIFTLSLFVRFFRIDNICCSIFYVRLLDYSILLKVRHDELIHQLIYCKYYSQSIVCICRK